MRKRAVLISVALLHISFASWTAVPAGEDTFWGKESTRIHRTDLPDSSNTQSEGIHIGGYVQVWYTVLEAVENGLRQPLTENEAAQQSSGFIVNRARLQINIGKKKLKGHFSIRFEGSPPGLLDAFFCYPLLGHRMELHAGQMKVPSTYEVALSAAELDFLTRSLFSQNIVDFSLCRTPTVSAPRFNSVRTYNRDLGVALKGQVPGVSYFIMVGNRFGANRFIGGRENKQEIFTNGFGSYLYAARLVFRTFWEEAQTNGGHPMLSFRAGTHVSWNNHPDIVLDDERTVLDIERLSWSADVQARVADFFDLTAMYGECFVEDDFDNNGRTDYRYHGWELKAVVNLFSRALKLGFRYDLYSDEWHENGAEDLLHSYVMGITFDRRAYIKLQLNYKWKVLESPVDFDLDDNVLSLAAQVRF